MYPLDAEWQRRYPAMTGMLACDCALRIDWLCQRPGGGFVDGHIPADCHGSDMDAWSHIGVPHTHTAAVTAFPDSALAQGAEDYLRSLAANPRLTSPNVIQIREAVRRWDEHRPTQP
ncbi:hypothetical protein [Actinocorallia populi]|uniref:hypothetical protein n=1 Tax=Actinocorallia populi TaxID=2079200 RepID=UPI001300AE1B|nr:hypothetical protein [Actinocorallia populi]